MVTGLGQTNSWDGLAEDAWNRAENEFSDVSVGNGLCSITFLTVSSDGTSVTNVGVIGEDGKFNLNTILETEESKAVLRALIESKGELESRAAEMLVAAIEDWIDDNDEMLTGGAESGYYASQSPSYRCANGQMRSISELRMIKGVSRELFARLVPYVTVYGAGHVNMNCAPEPVIAALAQAYASGTVDADVCESLAEKIGEFRRSGGGFRTDDDIRNPPEELGLTGVERGLLRRMASGLEISSTAFRGISSGTVGVGDRSEMSVEFVFDTRNDGAFVYWHEFQ